MGAVFRCADTALDDQAVAVKLLPPEHTASEVARGRVKQEVVSARSLRHPNIVGVYEYFEGGGRVGFSMEFVAGHTLEQHLAGRVRGSPLGFAAGPDRLPLVGRVASQLAAALDHVHASGLVHRDVKPANVMLVPSGEGVDTKLLDLGIVHATDGAALTRDLQPGTVEYMAPELLSGHGTPSVASDLYSLGKLLYFALTGVRPEFGYEPALPSLLVDGLPVELDGPLLACFGRPDRRPASAGELARAVAEAVETQRPPTTEADDAVSTLSESNRKRPGVALRVAAGVASVLLVLLGVFLVTRLMGDGGSDPGSADRTTNSGNPALSRDSTSEGAPPETAALSNGAGIDWVQIAGGTFAMGWNDGLHQAPVHDVSVPSFEIGRTEVTVDQYRACVDAGACSAPDTDQGCNWGVSGRGDHPVNCVKWTQARSYAEWAGGRLPSEAEWEYAARSGGEARAWPWGDQEASCSYAVMYGGGNGCGEESTWAVCSKPAGNTDQGLCDMAGNAGEWVEDCHQESYTGAPADGSARTSCSGHIRQVVGRGGAWVSSSPSNVRATFRFGYNPSRRSYRFMGFRLARDVP